MLKFSPEDINNLGVVYNQLTGRSDEAVIPVAVAQELVFIAARFGPQED